LCGHGCFLDCANLGKEMRDIVTIEAQAEDHWENRARVGGVASVVEGTRRRTNDDRTASKT
jgi:hypothetical protein